MQVLSGEIRERVRGMQDGQEKKQLKMGLNPQAGFSGVCGKLWGADDIAGLPGLLCSHISQSLAVGGPPGCGMGA